MIEQNQHDPKAPRAIVPVFRLVCHIKETMLAEISRRHCAPSFGVHAALRSVAEAEVLLLTAEGPDALPDVGSRCAEALAAIEDEQPMTGGASVVDLLRNLAALASVDPQVTEVSQSATTEEG